MTDKIHATGLIDQGTYDPNDRLLAGEGSLKTEKMTLVTDAAHNLKRGCLLGRLTANGKATLYASGGSDGSENGYAILAGDADATAADVECIVYVEGPFSEQEILAQTTGLSFTDALRAAMRDKGMFVRKVLE